MRAIDMGSELGASVFVMWGGREGLEVEASKDPIEAIERYREGVEFLANYIHGAAYQMRIAIEPKPNEPRGDIFLATAGHVLAFVATLDPSVREMVGVNPEIQHSRMAGMNSVHEIAQCIEAGKLYHIDLGAQKPSRFDQDLRFGSEDIKETFFVVKLLEESGWDGTRNFDVNAGCMRSYLVLRDKARRYGKDREIQQLVAQLRIEDPELADLSEWSRDNAKALKERRFDLGAMSERRLGYQKLDQLVFDLLTGAR